MTIDLNVMAPYERDTEEENWYLSVLRMPLGYQLVRTLNLTKHYVTNPTTGVRRSVPTRGFLGEVYEYRNVLRLDHACASVLPVPGGLPGDLMRCQGTATYRAVAHQGYPIEGSWRVCNVCAVEDTETDYVRTVDGMPYVR